MPFLPLSRSDNASLLDLFKFLGVKALFTVDIHSEVVRRDIEIHNINNISIIPEVVRKVGIDLHQLVIVSPDRGGYKRAQYAAMSLKCKFISMEKIREDGSVKHICHNSDLVRGRSVLIVDDIIDSCATINSAAHELIKYNAKSVDVLAIHGILSKQEFSEAINQIYITNTVSQDNLADQIIVVDVKEIVQSKVEKFLKGILV